jgi:hypothetical protein
LAVTTKRTADLGYLYSLFNSLAPHAELKLNVHLTDPVCIGLGEGWNIAPHVEIKLIFHRSCPYRTRARMGHVIILNTNEGTMLAMNINAYTYSGANHQHTVTS